MAPNSSNSQKGGINSGLKGNEYQVKVMLLTLVKSYKNSNFKVETEVVEANPFDDIVVQVNSEGCRLIQCKSKDSSKTMKFSDFFSDNKGFNLCKYFVGYMKIKQNRLFTEIIKDDQNQSVIKSKTKDVVICCNNSLPYLSLYENSNTKDKGDGEEKINFRQIGGKDDDKTSKVNINDATTNKKKEYQKEEIDFTEVEENDEIFGNFKRYKLIADNETITTIKKKLEFQKCDYNKDTVDADLKDFLSHLIFVFECNVKAIKKEIDEFLSERFNLSAVDSQKSILKCILYDWIMNLKKGSYINKESFDEFLNETEKLSQIIPKVIDRSDKLFASSNFQFKITKEFKNFIGKIKNGSNQLFYMQVEERDMFYGSCMVKQELNPRTDDECLFLSTNQDDDIVDGLKVFSIQNYFDFLIFIENKGNKIKDEHRKRIKKILEDNKQKIAKENEKIKNKIKINIKIALIITDEIIGTDENLLKIPKIKLSDLSPESLELFLKNELTLQGEVVTLKSVLDPSFCDLLNLKNLEGIQFIGSNVIAGKNFDPDLYIERNLLHRNVIEERAENTQNNNEKIALDESSFDTFCNQFPAAKIHLLEPQNNKKYFVWKKSRGKIDFLFKYVDDDQGTEINNPWDPQATSQKMFILVDIPGMGKTFWMNHLAQQLKSKQKNHFVVNLSFNDHTEYFNDDHKFENEESVLRFLECEVLKLQNDTEKQIFRSACTKTGKVYVILDGLDEVYPDLELEMFKLIELLNKMPISGLFVSTRPELRKQLEEKMQNFCHELVPFSIENQINFLLKFWSKKERGQLTDDELRAVAKKVVFLIEKKQLTEIAGIPLITRMVAEIFDFDLISKATQYDVIVENTISNISNLYEKFVDKNIERYLTEKLNLDLSKRGNRQIMKREKQKFKILYTKMALKLILPQHLNLFDENSELTSDNLEEMRKCGLMLSDSEMKFIHRTIAEYFVALAIQEKFNDEKIAKIVIQEIFRSNKFKIIRSFLISSAILKSGEKIYGKCLMESKEECGKSVKIACEEKNGKILEFIFESLLALKSEAAKKFVLNISNDESFLELYIKNVNDNLKIFEIIEKDLGLDVLKDLLLYKDFHVLNNSVENPINCHLLLSLIRQNFNDSDEFWEKFQQNSCEFLNELLYTNFNQDIFTQILKIESEKKISCTNKFFINSNFLIPKLPKLKRFGCNLEASADYLSSLIEIKRFKTFMYTSFKDKSIEPNFSLDLISRSLSKFLQILDCVKFSHFSNLFDSIKKIAFRQLLRKSKCQDQNFYQEIREKLKSEKLQTNLSEEELIELQNLPEFFKINDKEVFIVDEFVLQIFGFFSLNSNDPEIIQIFFHVLVESDNFDGISYLLFEFKLKTLNSFGRFMLDHLNYEVVESADDLQTQKFHMTAKEFCKKFKNKMIKKFEPYYKDVKKIEEAVLFYFMRSLVSSVESEDDRKKLKSILLAEDENQQKIVWPGYFFGFLKHCMETFGSDFDFDMKSALKEEKFFDLINSDETLINGDENLVVKLIQWIVKKYGNDHSALEYQDRDGNTLLHFSVGADLYNSIYRIIPEKIVKKLLQVKNKQNQNFLFKWNRDDRKSIEKIKNDFGYEYLENLLLERDENGDVFIAKIKCLEYFYFSESFDSFLTNETIKKLILNQNLQEQNFLFVNLRFNFNFIVWIFKKFGPDQELFEELLNTKDEDDESFLEYVERSRTSKDTPLWEKWNVKSDSLNTFEKFYNFLSEKFPIFLNGNQNQSELN